MCTVVFAHGKSRFSHNAAHLCLGHCGLDPSNTSCEAVCLIFPLVLHGINALGKLCRLCSLSRGFNIHLCDMSHIHIGLLV